MQYVCVCICICTILSKSFLVNVCYDQYIGHNRDSETREHHQWHNEDRGEGHGGSRALHTEGMVRVHVFPISPPRRVPLRGPEPVQSMEVEGKAKRHNMPLLWTTQVGEVANVVLVNFIAKHWCFILSFLAQCYLFWLQLALFHFVLYRTRTRVHAASLLLEVARGCALGLIWPGWKLPFSSTTWSLTSRKHKKPNQKNCWQIYSLTWVPAPIFSDSVHVCESHTHIIRGTILKT